MIVVKDIERSKQFYKKLFGLDVVLEQEGNVILTEGFLEIPTASAYNEVSIFHLQRQNTAQRILLPF